MKVLMFGWEFPPHISGGLGTASFGLTKGLSYRDVDIIFVVPKAHGDEDQRAIKLVGANEITMVQKKLHYQQISRKKQHELTEQTSYNQEVKSSFVSEKEMTYIEVGSVLIPYLSPEEYEKVRHEKHFTTGEIATQQEIASSSRRLISEMETGFLVNQTNEEGKIEFSGTYGKNLLDEVSKYAMVASTIARQHDFDVIHAHDWLTYAAGIAAKQATGKPLVIHVHATEFDRSGENVNQIVYDIERAGMAAADRIIAVSNLTRDTVIHKYGISPDKVVTVYNAVEPKQDADNQVVKKNVDERIVSFLGRITLQKGPEYFIEAAYQVLQRLDNVRFVMAGSGDMLRRMIRRTAALGISDKFHFTDFLKGGEVDKMLAMSDVFVMPSVSEPFGIVPLEAMRSNVPVIISKQSGVSEILRHALKVDFWDIEEMSNAIYGLLEYEGLSKMFRQYGKKEVDALKWENAAVHVKKVYQSVID